MCPVSDLQKAEIRMGADDSALCAGNGSELSEFCMMKENHLNLKNMSCNERHLSVGRPGVLLPGLLFFANPLFLLAKCTDLY